MSTQLALWGPEPVPEPDREPCTACGTHRDDCLPGAVGANEHRRCCPNCTHTQRTVVGCVYAAWEQLRARMTSQGNTWPPYAWCDHLWTTKLRARSPGPAYMPTWLELELWAAWRTEEATRRHPTGVR